MNTRMIQQKLSQQRTGDNRTVPNTDHTRSSLGENGAPVSISNRNMPSQGAPSVVPEPPTTSDPGYSAAMAEDPVFHMFPEPEEHHDVEVCNISENDRFMQKQYPMLYMNLNAQDHPSILDVQYEHENTQCPLCGLDRNTLDSIKVLKPEEVKDYLTSCQYKFTEDQVNVHLAHSVRDENVIGVIQNMTVDLIGKSYSLANSASLRIMNRIRRHSGTSFFVPDLDVAKVHNDAVKQFISLASTCQTLMKSKHCDNDRAPVNNPLL